MTQAQLYCTTCGRAVRGGHPAACNGPNQKFLTREELRSRLPRKHRRELSAEEWRELRDEQVRKHKEWIRELRELPL